ncbi:MAG: DUF2959 domain-containing protein [Desulfobacteraceae bacterium]|nr:MAG: DUF2959 domain-containing protein [Desulfobacteraceae bacterium]
MHVKKPFGWIALIAILFLSAGCQRTYYKVWETLGKEKRHLLRGQIEKARDDQQKASEEFKDALTRLKEMYGYEGGDLEKMYNRLSVDYQNCVQRADQVEMRIGNVQRIAEDLFKEWKREIDQIGNSEFRSKSNRQLQATQVRYARLEKAMLAARTRMTPVLNNLQDYVLYVKHNLNAQAIGSLKSEVSDIEADVQRLITDIHQSVREANAFLEEFETEPA